MNAYVICVYVLLLLSGDFFFFQKKTPGLIPNPMKQPAALSKVNKESVNRQESCYTSAVSPLPDPGLLKLGSALCGWWFSLQLDCSVIKPFLTTRRSSILACHLFYPCILCTFVTSALSKFLLCGCVWVRESPLPEYLICWVLKMCLSKGEETENKLLARSLPHSALFFSVRPR